jgi:hypothetical protein
MSKKDDRRKNRKEKRERSRVKRASYLHAGSLKPIDLPEGVNLYDYMKDAIRTGKTTDIMLRDGIDLGQYIEITDKTLEHFRVSLENRSNTADILLRFAMMYAAQDDGQVIRFPADDPALNYIADLWEYFNKLWESSK